MDGGEGQVEDRGPAGGAGGEGGFSVLIAGGGVAGLEAALALRELAGNRIEIRLLAPEREFVYRPLAFLEPFGLGEPVRIPLAEIAGEVGFSHLSGSLAGVEDWRRVAVTDAGEELGYDALLLALGSMGRPVLRGAVSYGGPASNPALAELLAEIRAGEVRRVAFAVTGWARWALPLYELALLTARYAREHAPEDVTVAVVTHEDSPLALFGAEASERVAAMLGDAGVAVRAGAAPVAVEDGRLRLGDGGAVAAERVVELPRRYVPPLAGVPQGPDGFIATNRSMNVDGLESVWAAGDATWYPIKQGGIAAQQADTAAAEIARRVDPGLEPCPFRPVLRGAIVTGEAPWYLRAEVGDRAESAAGAGEPLWWPPSKIAGRRLAPYLVRHGRGPGAEPVPELADLDPAEGEPATDQEAEHLEAVALALTMAEADARWHDYKAALRWLEAAEELNLSLPPGYAERRRAWRELLAETTAPHRRSPAGDQPGSSGEEGGSGR